MQGMMDNRYSNMGISGGGFQKEERWDSKIQWYELKPGTWNQIRIYGPVFIVAQNWFTTLKGKKFALFSLAWDPFERSYSKQDQDPIWQFFGNPFEHEDEKIKAIAPRQQAFVQAFIRPTVGVAQGGDFRPLRLPISVINGIRKASELNFKMDANGQVVIGQDGKPEIADPTDPHYGLDILVYYDPSKNGSEKYSVQLGGKSPITQQEMAYQAHWISWHEVIKMPSVNDVKEALSRNGYMALAKNAGANSFGNVAEVGAVPGMNPVMTPQSPVTPSVPAGPMAPPVQNYAAPAAPAAPVTPSAPMTPPPPGMGIGPVPVAPTPAVPTPPAPGKY
jgi:hypothetical protein